MEGPWSNPLVVANREMLFKHSPEEVRAAYDLVSPAKDKDPWVTVRSVIAGVHERLRVLPSAFGAGMPRTVAAIVERRGGNCVSHSVIATVVLRHVGLPTRLVSENVYTNISLIRALSVLMRAPVGPVLNGHVWIEVYVEGAWIPADAEINLTGIDEWLRRRLGGTTLSALGIPIKETWKFPLRIRRLGPGGAPCEDATAEYLVEAPSRALRPNRPLPQDWLDSVRYFSEIFQWDGRAGLRILGHLRRLKAMSAALSSFRGELGAPAAGDAELR